MNTAVVQKKQTNLFRRAVQEKHQKIQEQAGKAGFIEVGFFVDGAFQANTNTTKGTDSSSDVWIGVRATFIRLGG